MNATLEHPAAQAHAFESVVAGMAGDSLPTSHAGCSISAPWAGGWKGRMRWLKRYLDQQGRCAICRKQFAPAEMTKDHIIPRSKGGGTQWDNIQLACAPCNERKGDSLRHPNGSDQRTGAND